jgi:hypothetical protein
MAYELAVQPWRCSAARVYVTATEFVRPYRRFHTQLGNNHRKLTWGILKLALHNRYYAIMEEYSTSGESEKLLDDHLSAVLSDQRWQQSLFRRETHQKLIIGLLMFSLMLTNGLWIWSLFESGRQPAQNAKAETAYCT